MLSVADGDLTEAVERSFRFSVVRLVESNRRDVGQLNKLIDNIGRVGEAFSC
ncbi:hypothetical protein T190_28360 [Sinorhizobium meliloti CCBAU 01290]|nr:hypothetical protein T190_28360 [Sinorhizobium meliloti CCBAU 01290]